MKINFSKILVILPIILILGIYHTSSVFASKDHIIVPTSLKEMDISRHLDVLVDTKNSSDEQILNKLDMFSPISQENISGDITNATYWVKVDLSNSSNIKKDLLLEIKKPHLSSVSLYRVKDHQLILEEKIGYGIPFHSRSYKHRNMVFQLKLQPTSSSIYLLKIQTDSFFQAPVFLWDPVAFSEKNYISQTGYGLFYGIMFAMILYNSFLFFSLREKSYLYYILFITGFTILQSIWDGFAFQWIWGDLPWWALRSNSFFILWSALFSLQFAKHFLQLKEIAPRLNKVVTTFNVTCAVCLLMPFILNIGAATMISTVIATIFSIFIIVIAIKVRLKTGEAKFFITAWSFLLIGVLLNILAAYKLMPLTTLTLMAPKIGALIEVLVLSLGLADKIKRLTIEKEQESKKAYIHTFLQHSFKQMSMVKEVKLLIEQGLACLINMTNFTKGVYLVESNGTWKVISRIGSVNLSQPTVIEKKYTETYFYRKKAKPGLFGINDTYGSILTLPIKTDDHTGLFIVYHDTEDKRDQPITLDLLPIFREHYLALLENIQSYENLKKSAMYDHLTNVLNRRYFLEKAEELYRYAEGLNKPVSLLLIDIDHFKKINDTYGHLVGDQAIIFVANQIKSIFKNKGIVGRFGGEEFIVFLPNADRKDAMKTSDLLMKAHRSHRFTHQEISLFLTISIGVCTNQFHSKMNLNEMIQHADDHLYIAKNNGRDQVAIYS